MTDDFDKILNPPLKQVGKRFEDLTNSNPMPAPENVKSIDESDYRDACSYIKEELSLAAKKMSPEDLKRYGKGLLNAQMLKNARRYIVRNWSDIVQLYPDGGICCLTAIPTSPLGHTLKSEEIHKGEYMKVFYKSGVDGKTYDFASTAAPYFELLPDFIRKNCSFKVEGMRDLNTMGTFITQYTKAFNALRSFFGLSEITEVELSESDEEKADRAIT